MVEYNMPSPSIPDQTIADITTDVVQVSGSSKYAHVYNVVVDGVNRDITEIQIKDKKIVIDSRIIDPTGTYPTNDVSGANNTGTGGLGDPRPAQIILTSQDPSLSGAHSGESSILIDAQYISLGNNGKNAVVDFNGATVTNFSSSSTSVADDIRANTVFADGTPTLSGDISSTIAFATGTSTGTNVPDMLRSALVNTGEIIVWPNAGTTATSALTDASRLFYVDPTNDAPVLTLSGIGTNKNATLAVTSTGTGASQIISGTATTGVNSVTDNTNSEIDINAAAGTSTVNVHSSGDATVDIDSSAGDSFLNVSGNNVIGKLNAATGSATLEISTAAALVDELTSNPSTDTIPQIVFTGGTTPSSVRLAYMQQGTGV
eukprot:Pompholyxophrys_sp_v1_NODE_4_length_15125_cov_6.573656.p3 type:complete len:375 gc:universal NODE_4_length_15125_cov_6.573656:2453-3577(+)